MDLKAGVCSSHGRADTRRNVRSAERKDEESWNYKEAPLLRGSSSRAIKLSRQARNLLMAHMHALKMRETKGNVSDGAVTSPF